MAYTLNYKDSFDEIKSMNTATNIDLILSKDGLPYDFTNISDRLITVKIANQNGYIKDLPVNISDYTDDEKASGTFTLELNDDFMKEFPPDIYYLEVWINTSNNNRIIFPSNDNILPFTINSNIVNGSDAIPMITFYQVKQDVESTKKLVFDHEAKIEKYINSLNGKKNDIINDINRKIQDYYKFSNNIKATLNSLNSKVFNESDNINNRIDNINNNVSNATSVVNNAGKDVKDSIEDLINSAKSNISYDINTNSAINLITSGAENAEFQVNSVVNSARDKLTNTAKSLTNKITDLTQNGTKQIDVAAGSAATHLTNISRNTTKHENDAISIVNSTASSANNNLSISVSSFDDNVATATNSLNNYISNTRYNYSHLNDQVTSVSNTISNSVSSTYSYISSVRDRNTSQMVYDAVSKFNKSTGINNAIPKSVEKLSETISSNHSLAESYYNVSTTTFSNYNKSISALSISNDSLHQSLASLTSSNNEGLTNLASSYSKYLTTAKSYTDDKLNHLPKNTNSTDNIVNLVPINRINKLEVYESTKTRQTNIFDMRDIFGLNNLKAGTYWLSCHVIEGGATYICQDQSDYPIDGNTDQPIFVNDRAGSFFHSGQDCKYKLVLNEDSDYSTFGIGNNDNKDPKGTMACTITNLCVTKSDNFVPFSIAEKNRQALLLNDVNKPNLIPVPSFDEDASDTDYRIFNVPVIKGHTYWFSCHIDDAEHNNYYPVYFATSWENDGKLNAKHNGYEYKDITGNELEGGIYSGLKCKWVADRTGNLPIGVTIATTYKSKIQISKFCVTETDNFISYEMAQQNRRNIQSVFNTILNNNNYGSATTSNSKN